MLYPVIKPIGSLTVPQEPQPSWADTLTGLGSKRLQDEALVLTLQCVTDTEEALGCRAWLKLQTVIAPVNKMKQ
jgi:hypothetical protein